MEYFDYDNLESQPSTCGLIKESFTKDVGFARAALDNGLSTPHFHKKMIEHYMIIDGTGKLRVKLTNGEIKSVNIKPGVVVKIMPNEIHQAKTETGFTVEAVTFPAWTEDDEFDTEESLF